jgi:nucleoid DNA-binding protein
MKLETVIHTILQSKNFITIPGLGSFVSQYQPARIIKSDYVKFIPPRKVLAFNSLVQKNDGVLLSILQSDYTLSEEQALKEIELFVDTTKEILNNSNLVNLQGLGTLYYSNQALQFEPSLHETSMHEYGLSDFSVHILPNENQLKEYIEKKKSELPLHKKIIKATFILSPVLFGALLIPNIIHAPQMTGLISLFRDTDAYVDFTIPRKPIPVLEYKKTEPLDYIPQEQKTVANELQKQTTSQTHNETITPPEKVKTTKELQVEKSLPVEEKNTVQRVDYYIIVASYNSEENAQNFVKKLREQHKQAGIITNNGKIRVFIDKSKNKEIAKNSLRILKQNQEYKSAWIYSENV